MTGRRSFKRLSAVEASRALYIDFEGEKDHLPVLLGILHRRGKGARPFVHQVVVDAAFDNLGCPVTTLRAVIENVAERADCRDRRIVSWSQHDLDVVRTLSQEDPELVARFEARYANALGVAKRWRNKLHADARSASGRLGDYLALVGYRVPREAVAGRVGATIRIVRPRLEGGRSLTVRQQERWDELLEHNRHDCAGMRLVCLRATEELDATAHRSPWQVADARGRATVAA